jgi:ATP-dependent DNA helicase RecG
VQKVSGRAEANRFWNYPYDALEEAVVNSMYHRDYQQHEPVEITIEPEGVSILNCPGPDRSIPMLAIEKGDNLKSRRYRNRRLGDFLKELDLTEGRSTGIPTIQEKLAANGSPRATFETTEDRLTFLIHIPVHAGSEKTTETATETATEKTTETATETATEKTTEKIVRLIRENPHITNKELAAACGITEDGVYWNTKKLRKNNIIRRVGGDFGGHWEVLI